MVSSITATSTGTTATFQLVANANNRLNIYENNAVVFNDAAGTGFTAGTVIASLTPTNLISSSFQNTVASKGFATFNQTGRAITTPPAWPRPVRAGRNSASPSIRSPGLLPDADHHFALQLQLLRCVRRGLALLLFTSPNGGASFAPNVGAINGVTGPDVQFQFTGITQSFNAVVPEPSSFALACAQPCLPRTRGDASVGRPQPVDAPDRTHEPAIAASNRVDSP